MHAWIAAVLLVAQPTPSLRPSTILPMWLSADLPAQTRSAASPTGRLLLNVHRAWGQVDGAQFSFVYALFERGAGTSLDQMERDSDNLGFDSGIVRGRTSSEAAFTRFVAGSENGWRSFRMREIRTETAADARRLVFQKLLIYDGASRSWTLTAWYPPGNEAAERAANRLLGSVKLMNRVEWRAGENLYEATAQRSGAVTIRRRGEVPEIVVAQ